jgi:hypothetical protein
MLRKSCGRNSSCSRFLLVRAIDVDRESSPIISDLRNARRFITVPIRFPNGSDRARYKTRAASSARSLARTRDSSSVAWPAGDSFSVAAASSLSPKGRGHRPDRDLATALHGQTDVHVRAHVRASLRVRAHVCVPSRTYWVSRRFSTSGLLLPLGARWNAFYPR